jgi:hypothetical protein
MPFCQSVIPPLNNEAPVVGATLLLPQFISLCAASDQRSLFFTAPFYDSTFLNLLASNFDLRSVRLEAVVRTKAIGESLLQDLRDLNGSKFSLYICERLHAKVYVFESVRKDLAGLIGSHNPTISGMTSNIEVGVVLRGNPKTPNWSTLDETRRFLIGSALPYTAHQNNAITKQRS